MLAKSTAALTLAILCSGQGPQDADMFRLTARAPEAADLFGHAASLLGNGDPRELVEHGSEEALHENRVGQILCTLQPLAAAAALRGDLPDRFMVAGYSVGELAAWGVAKFLAGPTTLNLAARRAELMDAQSRPGDGLVFVRGLSRAVIDELCQRCDAALAIVNPGNAYVIGGRAYALNALMEAARGQGADRVRRLHINVASHTRFLAAASAAFRTAIADVPVSAAPVGSIRLFSGLDGAVIVNVQSAKDQLALQISQPLQWSTCLESCVEAGASHFLELGPGRALSEMVAGAYPLLPARSLSDFKTRSGVGSWLARMAN